MDGNGAFVNTSMSIFSIKGIRSSISSTGHKCHHDGSGSFEEKVVAKWLIENLKPETLNEKIRVWKSKQKAKAA
tara:strand:+ start:136 stop:357 length:222 start_codon:yes stop_codon:yes gene_type:complete